ncbi:MAG: riboflavin biosynthesis protein RibF [Clostridia bacterium]|nr:riboflavin biosynthesis protein RibF [Clostridia bacterium]
MKNAVILGTFDGLHRGHQAVINCSEGYNIIAVTFNAPPKMHFDKSMGVLMQNEDRFNQLKELGVSEIYALDFNEVKSIEPYDFLQMINEKYLPRLFVCGFNYRFGRNAEGDTDTLKAYCEKNGIDLKVADSVDIDGQTVSSTLIRNLISEGDIERANTLLYKPFGFTAEVINGDKRGRNLGFPTANQIYPKEMQKLKFGVYRSRVLIDGIEYKGISNIGIRPTYRTEGPTCETYIYDFSGDIYGKYIRIEPLKFLREEQKFSTAEELKKAVLKDIFG